MQNKLTKPIEFLNFSEVFWNSWS